MAIKISIRLSCPIRFERIRNGEKVIVQTGPDEYEVDVQESMGNEPFSFTELHKLIAEGERHIRKARAQEKKCAARTNPVVP